MKKRRQFRLRHRTQRSLGKKEKITTQKIGKYTARYCDILNRNNRKRQKKERYRAIKAESPAVYTKNTPTSDGSIGQRSGKTHKSGIRLAAYTQNPTHCTQKNERSHRKKSTDYRKSSQCKNAERGQTKQKQGTTSNKQGKISETIESTKSQPDTVSSQKNRRQRGANTPCRRFQQRLLINVSQNA